MSNDTRDNVKLVMTIFVFALVLGVVGLAIEGVASLAERNANAAADPMATVEPLATYGQGTRIDAAAYCINGEVFLTCPGLSDGIMQPLVRNLSDSVKCKDFKRNADN